MLLSVIVCTSPGREVNLAGCLHQLGQQSRPADEILVMDDGSAQGEKVIALHQNLPLRYDWRPNTLCVSQSRNLGAEAAQGDILIFLDSDILLNPLALEAYELLFSEQPDALIYSYFGNVWEDVAPSVFLREREVIWCDTRFQRYRPQGLEPLPGAISQPHEWAWSANFALSKKQFEQSSGFDERFQGWGGEDLDFARRCVMAGFQLHYFLDAWGEQQRHSHLEPFHTMSVKKRQINYVSDDTVVDYPVQVISSARGWQNLSYLIYAHYLKRGKCLAQTHPTRPVFEMPDSNASD